VAAQGPWKTRNLDSHRDKNISSGAGMWCVCRSWVVQQRLLQQDRTRPAEWLLAPVKVLTVAIDEEREIGNGQCSTAQCGECGTACYKLFSFLQLSCGGAAGEG